MILSFLTLFFGIDNVSEVKRLLILFIVFGLQGFLIFEFISNYFKAKRESVAEEKPVKSSKTDKVKKEKKSKESDLPEADQNAAPAQTTGAKKSKAKVK
jgi:translocating chain-associated membrane protein 1